MFAYISPTTLNFQKYNKHYDIMTDVTHVDPEGTRMLFLNLEILSFYVKTITQQIFLWIRWSKYG